MTEFIITRCDGEIRQVLGTVQAGGYTEALSKAFAKWRHKPQDFFVVSIGSPAEIRFARDMEADGIISDLEFEENMTQWLGAKEGAR